MASRTTKFTALEEVEKGFGPMTSEAEFHFERNRADGVVEQGVGNIDLGARYPLFQYVSASGGFDTTFGVGVEVGIPVHSTVSKNLEFVPKVFNDTIIGNHFTLQTVIGYSTTYGQGEDSNSQVLEYGSHRRLLDISPHNELPIPGVQQLIPIFEVSGEKADQQRRCRNE